MTWEEESVFEEGAGQPVGVEGSSERERGRSIKKRKKKAPPLLINGRFFSLQAPLLIHLNSPVPRIVGVAQAVRGLGGADDGEDGQGERGRGRSSSECALAAIDLHLFSFLVCLLSVSIDKKARPRPREMRNSCVRKKEALDDGNREEHDDGRGSFLSRESDRFMSNCGFDSLAQPSPQNLFFFRSSSKGERASILLSLTPSPRPVSPTLAGHLISLSPSTQGCSTVWALPWAVLASTVREIRAWNKGAKETHRSTIDLGRSPKNSKNLNPPLPSNSSSTTTTKQQPSTPTPRSPPSQTRSPTQRLPSNAAARPPRGSATCSRTTPRRRRRWALPACRRSPRRSGTSRATSRPCGPCSSACPRRSGRSSGPLLRKRQRRPSSSR